MIPGGHGSPALPIRWSERIFDGVRHARVTRVVRGVPGECRTTEVTRPGSAVPQQIVRPCSSWKPPVPPFSRSVRQSRLVRDVSHKMGSAMVKVDLVARTAEAANLKSPAAQDAVDALFESVVSALARGDRVALRRFWVFHTRPRRTGIARNPRTNQLVRIPAGREVCFRPATNLRRLPGDN